MISEKKFEERVGRPPENDDMCRVNCESAGKPMHRQCGWCEEHDLPNFMCGCTCQEPEE